MIPFFPFFWQKIIDSIYSLVFPTLKRVPNKLHIVLTIFMMNLLQWCWIQTELDIVEMKHYIVVGNVIPKSKAFLAPHLIYNHVPWMYSDKIHEKLGKLGCKFYLACKVVSVVGISKLIKSAIFKVLSFISGWERLQKNTFWSTIIGTIERKTKRPLSRKTLWKWDHFERAKPILKMLPSTWNAIIFWGRL